MSNYAYIPHPLPREGTQQSERFPDGLKEEYVKIDERQLTDLVGQTAEYASLVKFYNDQDSEDGAWKPFFEEVYDYSARKVKFSSVEELEKNAETSPHIALFLAFLRLLGIAQENLNTLTRKHLDFYYRQILQLKPKEIHPDKVTVFFENEKNTPAANIPKDTVLLAGKDKNGKDRHYKTRYAMVSNQAKVDSVRNMQVRKDASGQIITIHTSVDAPNDTKNRVHTSESSWFGFGSPKNGKALIGFAIASPVLNLKEGDRRISLRMKGLGSVVPAAINAEYTTEKGWEPAEARNASDPAFSNDILLLLINPGQPAMMPYSEKVHKAGLSTGHPVLRISLSNDTESLFSSAFRILRNTSLEDASVIVQVDGVHGLVLQTDMGVVDNTKPFLPYGPNPVKGKSSFYVGNNDIFNKYLESFNLSMNWKGLPGNIYKHYESWDAALRVLHPGDSDIDRQIRNKYFNTGQFKDFVPGHPPGKVSILSRGLWKELPLNQHAGYSKFEQLDHYTNTLNTREHFRNVFKPAIPDPHSYQINPSFNHNVKSGFIKIDLGYDFGQSKYPYLYSSAAMNAALEVTKPATPALLPKSPYTPELNSIHIDYTASAELGSPGETDHQVFQMHPFGNKLLSLPSEKIIPGFENEGELLIGLAGVVKAETVSLFFGLENEGINPDLSIGDANKISWSYLSGNDWVLFGENEILRNSTNNFSGSGIIHFSLPEKTPELSTILPGGLVWIKAGVPSGSDAYPALYLIRAQAAEAEFFNRDNETTHLIEGLPQDTISKPIQPIVGLKTISQPYPSYDGRENEQAEAFYTRISERLRHKGRAWSIWDYERLLLDRFPTVVKVKCIPHTKRSSQYSPGDVLLVLLPDCRLTGQTNALQPRISNALAEQVKAFLSTVLSAFIRYDVVSPVYEQLRVICEVALKEGYGDIAFYRESLSNELRQFLAPWTANNLKAGRFGERIYKSQIINFIEERPYIDFIKNFTVYKTTEGGVLNCSELITGSKECVILTSANDHSITIL